MGLQPSKPDDAGGDCIGALKLDGSGTCGCSRPYVFPDGGLCAPSPPKTEAWKAAYKELGALWKARHPSGAPHKSRNAYGYWSSR